MNIQKAIRNRLKSLEEIDDITIFVDPNGQASQAIVSIWTKLDAIKFCSLYINLVELRAMR